MTPTDLIRSTATALGSQSAREVLAYLLTRRSAVVNTERTITKPPEQMTRETMAVAKMSRLLELVTGSALDPVTRIRNTAIAGGIPLIIATVAAAKNAQTDAAIVAEIERLEMALSLLYQDHERNEGEWPIPAHFGLPAYTEPVSVVVHGSTHWAFQFPDMPPPSMDEVAAMMEAT